MSDKTPSPWSEEFHTGNTTKRIGGDEIQHGIITRYISNIRGRKISQDTINEIADGYVSDAGLKPLEAGEFLSGLMSTAPELSPKTAEQIFIKVRTAVEARQKALKTKSASARKPSGKTSKEYQDELAYNSKKNNYALEEKRTPTQVDFQRQQREEEAKRKKVAAAKANAAAKKGGRDRM